MIAANAESLDDDLLEQSARSARLEARVTKEQKSLLQRAAALQGRSLSDFLVSSAQEAATRVIQEHETIRLSRTDRTAFILALLNPPAPQVRLAKAAKTYRAKTGM
ncbi:MAG: DUF1778 domain-containing protein [Thiobacillaceae bacterium]